MTTNHPSAAHHAADRFPSEWWMTVPELCMLLSIAPALWERWRQDGTAPVHTIGLDGITRVHRADLTAWLDRQRELAGARFLTANECRAKLRTTPPGTRSEYRAESARPRWLTVPQICAELQITPEEWQRWRADGSAPRHHIINGTAYVSRTHFDEWLDSLPRGDLADALNPDDFRGDI